MDFAALRTLHVDPVSAAFALTVHTSLLAALLPRLVALRSKEHWNLDSIAVRRGETQQAEVMLRLTSDPGDADCPERRRALMGVVMDVLEHLHQRWARQRERTNSVHAGESGTAHEEDRLGAREGHAAPGPSRHESLLGPSGPEESMALS